MVKKLVVLVAPNFGNAELVRDELVDIGYFNVQPTEYKQGREFDNFLSLVEKRDLITHRKTYSGSGIGISYEQMYNQIASEDDVRLVTLATLSESEQLESSFARNNVELDVISYFITDTTKALVTNALDQVGNFDDETLSKMITDMTQKQVYWASVRPGRFYGVLRRANTRRAKMLATQIDTDISDGICTDGL